MFDFGFSEMMLIALVMLIVVGPKRLPKVARTAGHLITRMQRYVSDVKSDISREMQLEDLKKLQKDVESQARDLERSVRDQMNKVEGEVRKEAAEIKSDATISDMRAGDSFVSRPPMPDTHNLVGADSSSKASVHGGSGEPLQPGPGHKSDLPTEGKQ